MIKNIVFDIGRVLIGFDWKGFVNRLFEEETALKVAEALWGSGHWHELDLANLSTEEILSLFCRAGEGYEEEIRKAFMCIGECVERRGFAIPLIESLHSRGYRVYYLSNMSEHVMGSNPEAFDFASHMDGGIYSCHVHRIKPDREIYEMLTDKYALIPEECLFIDDHIENIAVAKRLGWKGIVFKDFEKLEADLNQALTKDRGHDKLTVVCYGDSNTYGFDPSNGSRYPYEKRWTSILADRLGSGYEVVPEGLNGRTTAYNRPEASWKNGISSIISAIGTHKPVDIVAIMLGTNDSLSWLGLTAEDIAAGMESLVEIIEEEAPALQGYIPEIIVTVPGAILDFAADLMPGEIDAYSVQKSRDIAELYRKIADDHFCRCVDASRTAELSEIDGVHLSPEGHKIVADLMYKAITDPDPVTL